MPGLDDLPALTECEERSLKVFDNEIEKINDKYQGLIDTAKKEKDKKIHDLGGYKKYLKLVKDKQDNPSSQYTPTEQSFVMHVGDSIRKFKEKVAKLEEPQQVELEGIEENRKRKVKEIDRARERRKQSQEQSKKDYSVEVTRGDILELEVKGLEEAIERLGR